MARHPLEKCFSSNYRESLWWSDTSLECLKWVGWDQNAAAALQALLQTSHRCMGKVWVMVLDAKWEESKNGYQQQWYLSLIFAIIFNLFTWVGPSKVSSFQVIFILYRSSWQPPDQLPQVLTNWVVTYFPSLMAENNYVSLFRLRMFIKSGCAAISGHTQAPWRLRKLTCKDQKIRLLIFNCICQDPKLVPQIWHITLKFIHH